MTVDKGNLKNRIFSLSTTASSFIIPIFQYVPCTAVWFGIMSVPLIFYILFFFQNLSILNYNIRFLMTTYGLLISLLGVIIYIYSLIYQITYRRQLLQKSPYKIVRHPQYLSFIIITFGMTLIAFQTSPVIHFKLFNTNPNALLLIIWIIEVLDYIILGKIEDMALKVKYHEKFLEYANKVPFMFPFLKLKSNKRNN
jgi:protein-S-isoprenylcysteine O-methyltransferase Ste14